MTTPVRLWVAADHHAAFRAGGWAYLRAQDGAVTGYVGGLRTPSAEPVALSGLVEGLKGLPPGAAVEIHAASPHFTAIARRVSGVLPPPDEDLELWAQVAAALNGRDARFLAAAAGAGGPGAFITAWAELARDKAKAGPFRAAIPKTNLAKAGV